MFRAWPEALPAGVEVCAVQLPGREARLGEAPLTSLLETVDAAADGLRPYIDLPYALFGHSLGAFLSFELARRLGRDGGGPAHLLVSAIRAPQLPNRHAPLRELSADAFVRAVSRYNGIPEAVLGNASLLDLLLPPIRADFHALETYCYAAEAPLACPISCFGGLEDPLVERAELEAWREQTRGAFTLRVLPGGHFFLQSAQSTLLQAVSQDLEAALERIARA